MESVLNGLRHPHHGAEAGSIVTAAEVLFGKKTATTGSKVVRGESLSVDGAVSKGVTRGCDASLIHSRMFF